MDGGFAFGSAEAAALETSAGHAEVALGVGFLGGISKLALLGARGINLYQNSAVVGIGTAGAAAAAGALGAKAYADNSDKEFAHRLAEVRNHAHLTITSDTALGPAMRQLLHSFDWCLSVEEHRNGGLSGTSGPGQFLGGEEHVHDDYHGMIVSGSQRTMEKELRRHERRIWRMVAQQPPRALPKAKSQEVIGNRKMWPIFSNKTKDMKDKDKEAYERLFNPGFNAVSGDHGVCAALCYLVSSFIKFRHQSGGSYDSERASLRLAVLALARHPLFDEELPDVDSKLGVSNDVVEFRRGALALIPLLDAALAWRPSDPFGWIGKSEDEAGLLVAYAAGLCTFPAYAAKLRKSYRRASVGDTVTWRRLGTHLDVMRVRELPQPWSWIWLQAPDASMLVRNHTKVPLRVELYRPQHRSQPWADWPLIQGMLALFKVIRLSDEDDPVMVAEVGPGIEWALRPKVREGRTFDMKLVTTHDVVVCSKRLRRGQIFDFKVKVPERPRASAARAKDVKSIDGDSESVASTTAPSSTAHRLSIASTSTTMSSLPAGPLQAASGVSRSWPQPSLASLDSTSQLSLMAEDTEEPMHAGAALPQVQLDSAICPRCLREMRGRVTRPTSRAYADGVECDKCSFKILNPNEASESHEPFFHCRRCWFDLCHTCASQEMQDTWWNDE